MSGPSNLPDLNSGDLSKYNPAKWRLVIEGFRNLTFWCRSVTLPSVTLVDVKVPFRGQSMRVSGDALDFSPLSCEVIVDEEWRVYRECFSWITFLTRHNNLDQHNDKRNVGTLFHLSNKSNPIGVFTFFGLRITEVGSVSLSLDTGSDQVPILPVTFAFDYFEPKDL